MERSWIALGISTLALGCSGASLWIVLRQPQPTVTQGSPSGSTDQPVSLRRVQPESSSASGIRQSSATPDPVEAFQAQLLRNEEILLQLRQGELTRSQDQ